MVDQHCLTESSRLLEEYNFAYDEFIDLQNDVNIIGRQIILEKFFMESEE